MEILLCPIGILDVNTSKHAESLAAIIDKTGGKLEGCPGARALTDKFVIQDLCHDTRELTHAISNAMENAIQLPSPLR